MNEDGLDAAAASAQALDDALAAARLLAIDPIGLGGAWLRARPGPATDAWLRLFQRLAGLETVRRLPPSIEEGRLLGGLDLAASLAAGSKRVAAGLLAEAHGGALAAPMAERLSAAITAHLCAALDAGRVSVEREGISARSEARFCLIGLDESNAEAPDAPLGPGALKVADRLAFRLDLDAVPPRAAEAALAEAAAFGAGARHRGALAQVSAPDGVIAALAAAAAALGVWSPRAELLAVRAARAAAAADGRTVVSEADAALAAALVLGPRATRRPAPPQEHKEAAQEDETIQEDEMVQEPDAREEQEELDAPPPEPDAGEKSDPPAGPDQEIAPELILAAAAARAPDAALEGGAAPMGAAQSEGRAGPKVRGGGARGRPGPARPGAPGPDRRLSLLDTLRAAAPWARLRAREAGEDAGRLRVRRSDFRIRRRISRPGRTAIFVVDASGSSALHRLAEAKGAVELLLAESYVRRDAAALIAFRGTEAELVLPPTRALARAKRALAGLPGGGGTPIAQGVLAAAALADHERRRGRAPLIVLMTDGKANVGLQGARGRAAARADAEAAARAAARDGHVSVVIDIAPRPTAEAEALARALGGPYHPLPRASASGAGAARAAGVVRAAQDRAAGDRVSGDRALGDRASGDRAAGARTGAAAEQRA